MARSPSCTELDAMAGGGCKDLREQRLVPARECARGRRASLLVSHVDCSGVGAREKRIRLHVSDKSFDFNDLAWAVKDMLKSDDAEDLSRLLAYVEARDFDNIDTQQPLHELLLWFKECRCSDPRDNVFGPRASQPCQ